MKAYRIDDNVEFFVGDTVCCCHGKATIVKFTRPRVNGKSGKVVVCFAGDPPNKQYEYYDRVFGLKVVLDPIDEHRRQLA